MDWLLLGVVSFYFVKGFLRGFLSIAFSLFSTFLIFFLGCKLCQPFGDALQGLNFFNFETSISNTLNGMFVGEFSSVEELAVAIGQENRIFQMIVSKLFPNITFEGTLTAGEILSPTINVLIHRVVAFVIVFVLLHLLFSIAKALLVKMFNCCKLGGGNKILGGMIGGLKGLVVFFAIYVVLTSCANLFLNEGLLLFCQNGVASNYLYKNFAEKIISLFY